MSEEKSMLPAQFFRADFLGEHDSNDAIAAVVSIAEDNFKKVRFFMGPGYDPMKIAIKNP